MNKEDPIEIAFNDSTCIHCFVLDNLMAVMKIRYEKIEPSDVVISALRAVADFVFLHDQDPDHLRVILKHMQQILSEHIAKDIRRMKKEGYKESSSSISAPSTTTKQ